MEEEVHLYIAMSHIGWSNSQKDPKLCHGPGFLFITGFIFFIHIQSNPDWSTTISWTFLIVMSCERKFNLLFVNRWKKLSKWLDIHKKPWNNSMMPHFKIFFRFSPLNKTVKICWSKNICLQVWTHIVITMECMERYNC